MRRQREGQQQRKGGRERRSEKPTERDQGSLEEPGKKGHSLMLVAQQDGGDGGHSHCARQPWDHKGTTSWCVTATPGIFQNNQQKHLLFLFFTRGAETFTTEGLETDVAESRVAHTSGCVVHSHGFCHVTPSALRDVDRRGSRV